MPEVIELDGVVVATVLHRRELASESVTRFYSDESDILQVGKVVISEGGAIPAHRHKNMPRVTDQTFEVLYILSGECSVDFYNCKNEVAVSRGLRAGDLIVLKGGAHGFSDSGGGCQMLEVKNGPYLGVSADKERIG